MDRMLQYMRNAPKRPQARIPELLGLIKRVWKLEGVDLRLGQLLVNTIQPKGACPEVYNFEDSQLIELLRERLAQLEAQPAEPKDPGQTR